MNLTIPFMMPNLLFFPESLVMGWLFAVPVTGAAVVSTLWPVLSKDDRDHRETPSVERVPNASDTSSEDRNAGHLKSHTRRSDGAEGPPKTHGPTKNNNDLLIILAPCIISSILIISLFSSYVACLSESTPRNSAILLVD
ncbi:hypothetical protein B0H13DRAFT_2307822 [Mycena leptocephala]|nr:hypothetical protein B0H13DRAFT_2307822 [Mycena leptocephala]